MDVQAIRRANLELVKQQTYKNNQSEMARIAGRKPHFFTDLFAARKKFGEKLARSLENKLRLAHGSLDKEIPSEGSTEGTVPVPQLKAAWPPQSLLDRYGSLDDLQQAYIDSRLKKIIELFESEGRSGIELPSARSRKKSQVQKRGMA